MIGKKIFPEKLSLKMTVPFFHPALQVEKILAAERPGWVVSLLVFLTAGMLQAGIAAGYRALESQRAASPAGIVVAAAGAAAGIAVFWLVESEVFNILLLLNGGRTSIHQAKTLTAWAYFPFILREIERCVYMLVTGRAILYPGLSAAVGTGGSFWETWLQFSLGQIDVFFVWHAGLMLVAAKVVLGKMKASLLAAIIVSLAGWVLLKGAALAGFALLAQ